MSTLFRTGSTRSQSIPALAEAIHEQTEETSLYFTDGISLYRFLGAAAHGMGEMVELEDCRSLDVAVVPIGDLHARRLRVVIPAD
jgi:hypothetical protein